MSSIPPKFKWSFSKLSAFETCPMGFKLQYLDRVPSDGNAFSDYGTLCHKLLEEWAQDETPSFLLAEEYEKRYDTEMAHSFPPFPKGMPQKYYEAGLKYFESFDGFGDHYEIMSAEEKFELDIGGYTFVGIADLVLKDKNTGGLIVIDHKSKSANSMKKELDTYRKQLYIYAAHVYQKYGVYPEKLMFNMFKEGNFIEEEFDKDMYDQTMQWVVDTIENILFETDWEAKTNGYFCKFVCSVLDSCPLYDEIINPPKKKG